MSNLTNIDYIILGTDKATSGRITEVYGLNCVYESGPTIKGNYRAHLVRWDVDSIIKGLMGGSQIYTGKVTQLMGIYKVEVGAPVEYYIRTEGNPRNWDNLENLPGKESL